MKKYKSKVGKTPFVIVAIIFACISIALIILQAWVSLAIIAVVIIFMAYSFRTTYYVIDGNNLFVRAGFIINITVQIDKIKKIVETHDYINDLNTATLSYDRLAIYSNRETVVISPEDKIEFINHLKQINPNIEVVLK